MVQAMEEEQERPGMASSKPYNRSLRMPGGGADAAPPPTSPAPAKKPSDIEMMKEKFAKLLLGEDMSGGGKGVTSAAALSNAITNLAASVFGELRRLEPMSPDQSSRWRKEMDWLLSVTDHIVEFVPVQQTINGQTVERMSTKQRSDLQLNIPALRGLDKMLVECLDKFRDQNEFTYVKAEENNGTNENWWIPTPKVPPNGLSDEMKKFLQSRKETVNQVLKAAMNINSVVLQEMAVPDIYMESLPKNGKATLGESIYKYLEKDDFDERLFVSMMELNSDHKVIDLKNKIEASLVIWRKKMKEKDSKSSWGSMSSEKREQFEVRAKNILLLLQDLFPKSSQSALDISKIQYNRDVGHAILESYSRIIESLAHTVMTRIHDVIQADELARENLEVAVRRKHLQRDSSLQEQADRLSNADTGSKTLSDFMGWAQSDSPNTEDVTGEMDQKKDKAYPKKISYLENLGGSRSPTSRH